MDKQQFLYFLNNYRSLTRDETVKLAALQKRFPYSQAIRNMVAWGAYHNDLPTKKIQLYLANIYSPDVKALKAIITAPRINREKFPQLNDTVLENYKQQEEIVIDDVPPYSDPEMDKIINELPQELFYLKQAKNDFELKVKEVAEMLKTQTKTKPKTPTRSRASSKKPKKVTAVKKARTKKLVKKTVKKTVKKKKKVAKKTTVKKKVVKKKVTTKKSIKKTPTKTTKKKKVVAKTKKRVQKKPVKKKEKIPKKRFTGKIAQQEQFKIIEQFINTKPRIEIRKPPEQQDNLPDLSAAANSTYSKSVSDETLVKILIAQGKKKQAIEVLKKLIWKTPQRKLYFLAQIKKLEA